MTYYYTLASERQNARDARRPLLALDAAVAAVAIAPAQCGGCVRELAASPPTRRLRAADEGARAAVARRPLAVLEAAGAAPTTYIITMPVGAGPAVAVELAVTVYRGVVVVALGGGEGERE